MSDEEKTEQGSDEAAKAEAEAQAKAKAEAAAAARAKKAAEEAAKPPWERDPKPPEAMDASSDPLVGDLRSAHGETISSAQVVGDDLTLEVERTAIREVCASLASPHGYRLLVDICGVDYPQREEERFEVVYHVYNLDEDRRVRVRVRVPDGDQVPSVVSVWRGAEWCEREIYDMFGITFSDHPDLTRILTWDGFNGHPLRKDFPVEGIDTGAAIYPERYDEETGPVAGTGTGWKVPKPEPESEPESETEPEQQ